MEDRFEKVWRIAQLTREIAAEVTPSLNCSYAAKFPKGWCQDCSRVLGHLFIEHGIDGFTLVFGQRGEHLGKTHVWLQKDDLIVDITADQFVDEVREPVLITTDHVWHERWTWNVQEIDPLQPGGIDAALYAAIKNHPKWQAAA